MNYADNFRFFFGNSPLPQGHKAYGLQITSTNNPIEIISTYLGEDGGTAIVKSNIMYISAKQFNHPDKFEICL